VKLGGLVLVLALLARPYVTVQLAGHAVTFPAVVLVAVAEVLGLAGIAWLIARELRPSLRMAGSWWRP